MPPKSNSPSTAAAGTTVSRRTRRTQGGGRGLGDRSNARGGGTGGGGGGRAALAGPSRAAQSNSDHEEEGGEGADAHSEALKKALAEVAELRARLDTEATARREAEERAVEIAAEKAANSADHDEPEVIQVIKKPKGEAGNLKNGYRLITAMKLDGCEKDEEEYASILRSIHTHVIQANLDFTAEYRSQDDEALVKVFKMTRKVHPYTTKQRFPAYWPLADMVKQYLRNHRKYMVSEGRLAPSARSRKRRATIDARASGRNVRRKTRHIDEEEEGGEEDDEEGSGSNESGGEA